MVTVRFERRESPHALTTATPQAIASPRRWPEPWWRVDRHVRAVLGEPNGDRLADSRVPPVTRTFLPSSPLIPASRTYRQQRPAWDPLMVSVVGHLDGLLCSVSREGPTALQNCPPGKCPSGDRPLSRGNALRSSDPQAA